MQDAQFPPDADNAKGTPARRSGLRLSDAEIVATTRLDMFGDGSLKEALSTSPGPGDGQDPSSAAEAPPADPPGIPDIAVADAPRQSLPPADVQQRLGAGIEYSDAENPDLDQPESDAPRQSPDPERGQIAATAAHVEVSPIFSALDAADKRAEETEGHEVAPAMLDPGILVPPGWTEREGSAGPLSEQPRFRDELRKAPTSARPPDAVFADGSAGHIEESDAPGSADILIEGAADSAIATGAPEPPAESFAAGQEEAGMPPFPDPAGEPPFPEPQEVPAFPEPQAVQASPEFAEPYAFRGEPDPPAPVVDAAAKIAAEANATAEALENLKRLLGHKLPNLDPAELAGRFDRSFERTVPPSPEWTVPPSPRIGTLRLQIPVEPAPFAPSAYAPLLPLPVPPRRSSSKGIYLLGFLAGLGLSLMAGAALYFFISTG